MNKVLRTLIPASILSLVTLSATAQVAGTVVTNILVSVAGNANVGFNGNVVSTSCSVKDAVKIRVADGAASELIKLATAALLAGKKIDVSILQSGGADVCDSNIAVVKTIRLIN